MVDIRQAHETAKQYFAAHLNGEGVAKASQNADAWFFISGDARRETIGNIVISISKHSGEIALIDLLSDEGFALVRDTTPVCLPD